MTLKDISQGPAEAILWIIFSLLFVIRGNCKTQYLLRKMNLYAILQFEELEIASVSLQAQKGRWMVIEKSLKLCRLSGKESSY